MARVIPILISAALYALGDCTQDAATSYYRSTTVVKTTSGLLIGHPGPNRSVVAEFLGVPYAAPPIGELRFAPPVRLPSSNATLNASEWVPKGAAQASGFPRFHPQAQQIIDYFVGGAGTPQSEDCLTLNIWTKPTASAAQQKKPVLIFLHGGRFANGNTHTPFYDGQALADAEDVVVVTLNYRLNIFGFPGAPDAAGNLGLRDQRLAVEWIRDNIAGFGVTPPAWCSSDNQLAAWLWITGRTLTKRIRSRQIINWHNASHALGCGADENSLACMRTKSWVEILKAASQVQSAASDNPVRSTPPFYPQADEKLVFSDYGKRSRDGNFARLPYVLGNNDNEQGYYVISAYGRGVNVTKSQGDDFLLTSFTCPNHAQALSRRAAGVPVWQYRYFGDWESTRLYPTSGAYHGVDMHMIFGNSEAVTVLPPSEEQEQTVAFMRHLWVQFAADPVNSLSRAGWSRFEPGSESLARFAHGNSPRWSFVEPETLAADC
ncbi:hypothetical protein PG997_007526 [Apiospora hydei]|uniref:Carboxylesterase type B domain-containing protein n=1 Tax=Apiospora hydei TaxID=1337664 RepID=A0ABR1W898_9PEZI